MSSFTKRNDFNLLRLHEVKRTNPAQHSHLGPELLSFFKHSVEKRQTKLSKISECWSQLIPETMLEHCCLESFHTGTLRVIVDSSPHLYEMKQLLLAGLEQQLLIACKGAGLRKITLKRGQWYSGDGNHRKIRFD